MTNSKITIMQNSITSASCEETARIDLNYLKVVLTRKFPGLPHLDDMVQDTALKIWSKKYLYDSTKSAFNTWCVKIGYNVCIDNIRKEKVATRCTKTLTSQSGDDVFKFSPDTIGIKNLVNALDQNEKIVIDLAYYKGYTHQEISETMQIPLGTVKTRISRAITKLRKHFIEINQN
jgi:RNA polymerase sigma factor (sigma-70 family)